MSKEYKCNYCGKIVDKKTCVYSLDDNKKPFDIQCEDCYSKEKRGAILSTPQQGWENQGWKDKLEWQISCAVNSFISCDKNEKDIILEEDIPNLKSNLHKLFSTLLQKSIEDYAKEIIPAINEKWRKRIEKEREELAGKIEEMKIPANKMVHDLKGQCDFERNNTLSQVLSLIQ